MTIAEGAAPRTTVGRADLVRLLASFPRAEAIATAAACGFEMPVPVTPVERETPPPLRRSRAKRGATRVEPPATPASAATFWRAEAVRFLGAPEPVVSSTERPPSLTEADMENAGGSLFATPPPRSLTLWSRLWPILRGVLQASIPGREPDVAVLVDAWSRGQAPDPVPRVMRRAWASRVSLWIDRSARLVPFWSDQTEVCGRLHEACGWNGIEVRLLDRSTQAVALARGDLLAGFHPDPATPVLVLGDLGEYGSPAERAAWLRTAQRLRAAGVRVAALVPCSPARWDAKRARAWGAVPWERPRDTAKRAPAFWDGRADRLLTVAAPAALVQPGLLRELRRLLPASEADASTEADAWSHPDVRASAATGMVMHAAAQERRRAAFAGAVDIEIQDGVRKAIERWHRKLPRELLHAETLAWRAFAYEAVATPGDLAEALAFEARLEGTALGERGPGGMGAWARNYLRAWLSGMPRRSMPGQAAWSRRRQMLWGLAFEGVDDVERPDGVDPRVAYPPDPVDVQAWWAVRQVGAALVISPAASGAWASDLRGPGSPVAMILAAKRRVSVRWGGAGAWRDRVLRPGLTIALRRDEGVELHTDCSETEVRPWRREPWAVEAGRDRFGLWADFEVNGVVQRFRWIPPGRFVMGSLQSEVGRFHDEGPQHTVTWTGGRWLADTPVTQALWEAVIGKGKNPSRFKSAERPVEQVDWKQCREFAKRLGARLPTEAEWEYACRAGTTTATWLGDLKIEGANNAPLLDDLAWYGGNCGVGFELEDGQDTTGAVWTEKQYEFAKGGTHPARKKAPNPLGLFDMLGNVYEWCEDARDFDDGYENGNTTDPHASRAGSNRVIRGGAWGSDAGYVRAAFRSASAPAFRDDSLGFRLARGQEPSPDPGPEAGSRSDPPNRDAGRGSVAAPARDATAPRRGGRSDR